MVINKDKPKINILREKIIKNYDNIIKLKKKGNLNLI